MCFEFEALYWAKLAEEEEIKKEQARLQAERKHAADAETSSEEQPVSA